MDAGGRNQKRPTTLITIALAGDPDHQTRAKARGLILGLDAEDPTPRGRRRARIRDDGHFP